MPTIRGYGTPLLEHKETVLHSLQRHEDLAADELMKARGLVLGQNNTVSAALALKKQGRAEGQRAAFKRAVEIVREWLKGRLSCTVEDVPLPEHRAAEDWADSPPEKPGVYLYAPVFDTVGDPLGAGAWRVVLVGLQGDDPNVKFVFLQGENLVGPISFRSMHGTNAGRWKRLALEMPPNAEGR